MNDLGFIAAIAILVVVVSGSTWRWHDKHHRSVKRKLDDLTSLGYEFQGLASIDPETFELIIRYEGVTLEYPLVQGRDGRWRPYVSLPDGSRPVIDSAKFNRELASHTSMRKSLLADLGFKPEWQASALDDAVGLHPAHGGV